MSCMMICDLGSRTAQIMVQTIATNATVPVARRIQLTAWPADQGTQDYKTDDGGALFPTILENLRER